MYTSLCPCTAANTPSSKRAGGGGTNEEKNGRSGLGLRNKTLTAVVVRREVGRVQRGERGEVQLHLLLRRAPPRVPGQLRVLNLVDLLLQLHHPGGTLHE
jgi:hypothetical protein